jgi:dTDP-glucose pyrophosphorylase
MSNATKAKSRNEIVLNKEALSRIIALSNITLRDGLVLLNETGLQIILVVDTKGHLLGLLTDGDVRRALLRNLSLKVEISEIMNRNYTALSNNQDYMSSDLVLSGRFNHLPILDSDGKIVDLLIGLRAPHQHLIHNNIPVVIMAGGQGSRLSPLTRILPKPLIPVGDMTMLEKIMENFSAQGFRKFKAIVNYKRDLIKSYFNETGSPYSVEFIDENSPSGTAGGLILLKDLVKGIFILSNCDIIAELQYSGMIDWHLQHNAHLTILGVRKRTEIPYGVIKINEDSYITDIEEKPYYDHLIVSGIYVVDSSVIDIIPKDKPLGMDQLIKILIESGMKVTCYPIEKGWFDMGQFEEYRKLLRHFDEFNG